MANSDRRLTLMLSLVLVAVMLVGGTAAYAVSRSAQDPDTLAATGSSGGTPAAPVPSGSQDDATGTSTGPVPVVLSPSAAVSPQARAVSSLLSRYFTAINRHDYDAWLTTVTTAQTHRSRAAWTKSYSTTHDSEVYVSDITPGEPMTARIQFVSRQAIEFAPAEVSSTCVRWDVTYEILDEGVGLRVGGSVKDPALVAC